MYRKIISILTAVLVLTACSQTPITARHGATLFKDDFSVTPNGWGTMGREGGEIGFQYEGLVITVNLPNFLFWSVNGDVYADTKIDVDAVLLDGSPNDNFGVICRYQDNKNFYGFLVSHDGYYGIFKMIDGQVVMPSISGDMGYSDAIRQGGVVNHIKAICEEDLLTLIVNDEVLAEVKDASFSSGQIGLIAGAYDAPGVKILFDNLRVKQP